MSKFIALELNNLVQHIASRTPGILNELKPEVLEEISGHPSGWKKGLEEYLKHQGVHLAGKYPQGFQDLVKLAEASHSGEPTHETEQDSQDNEPGHHKKHAKHEEHHYPHEEHKAEEKKEGEKTQTVEEVEEEEPGEEYEEGPSEEPMFEPQMPMMPPMSMDEGGDEAPPPPQMEEPAASSQPMGGEANEGEGGGKKKEKGGFVENQAKKQVQNALQNKLGEQLGQEALKQSLGNAAKAGLQAGAQAVGSAIGSAASAIGGAVSSAVGAIIAAVGWPVLAIIAVIIIVLAIALFIALNIHQQSVPVYCGDFSDDITHTTVVFYQNDSYNDTMNKDFHINNHHTVTDPLNKGHSSAHDQDTLNAETAILNTDCLLFGHGKGYLTGLNNFSTFAKLLLGDRLDPSQDNGYNEEVNKPCRTRGCFVTYSGKDYMINQNVAFDDDTNKGGGKCYTTINRDDSQQLLIIQYYNPEYCSEDQFKYQIAESLSHALIFQQEQQYGKGNADILRNFEYGPLLGKDKLPVYTCSDSISRPYGTLNFSPVSTDKDTGVITGENESDEKQRFCFGDMVGEYMVYPYYVPQQENTSTIPTATPTPDVSPTSGASGSGMQPPAPPSPLRDYNTGIYKQYYEFARLNLFDGQEMYVLPQTSGSAASCPFTSLLPADELSQLSDWGFTINRGTDNSNLDKTMPLDPTNTKDQALIQKTFDTVCLLNQSPTYVSLLGANTSSTYKITISFNPPSGWGGYTSSITHVTLYDMDKASGYYLRFILTHELGHVLQFKNPSLVSKLDDTTGGFRIGSINCPRSDIQKIRNPEDRHDAQLAECFSDIMALYLTYPHYNEFVNNAPAGLTNFGLDPQYSNLYSFLFKYVFGGVEYFDSGRTKDLAVYAKNLNLSIQRSCPPPYTTDVFSRIAYVTANDKDCLKTLDFHPAKAVFDELWNDVIPTSSGDIPTLQCVGTVRASTIGIGADIGGNDAGAYADEDITGYQRVPYDSKNKTFAIQSGDILIWGHHIGIAVYVYQDKSVDLAESNIWFPGNEHRPTINGGVWIRSKTPYDTIVSGLKGIQRKE